MKKSNNLGLGGILFWLGLSLILGLLVWGGVSNKNKYLKTYLVQSGSMTPSIMVGDVILIKKFEFYTINDVVTFKDGEDRRVTHRIIDIKHEPQGKTYSTKGDANRSGDRQNIKEEQILGKVIFTIPKLGYLINFVKTKVGFGLLVILPAAWIVISELFILAKRGNS